jgi:acetyl-CoA carboxylase alpha subunit
MPIEQKNQQVGATIKMVEETETPAPKVKKQAKKQKTKKKGRKEIPENETALERSKRLANMRVPAAIKKLQLIENLFKGPQYEFSQEDARAIVMALSDVVCRIQERAEHGGKATESNKFHI